LRQTGKASYYGPGFYWNKTANGDTFYPWSLSAASKTLPLGTKAMVVNKKNGKRVYVIVNDRGPYAKNRILDLSARAARKIDMVKQGIATVEIYTHKK